MAVYEFTCANCDNKVTIANPITKKLNTPICGSCGYLMVRSYDVGSVGFKGSGFYSTDKK